MMHKLPAALKRKARRLFAAALLSGSLSIAIYVRPVKRHKMLWMRQRLKAELRIESVSISRSQ